MSAKAEWIAKRRVVARRAGVCITCCKGLPASGRAVCQRCSEQAARRTVRRRRALQACHEHERIIRALVVSGDRAKDHCLYADAALHYERALSLPSLNGTEWLEIADKLILALVLGDDPSAANPWIEESIQRCLRDEKDVSRPVELLLHLARQLWIDSKTKTAVSLLTRALSIAETSKDPQLLKMVRIGFAWLPSHLARYNEVATTLRAAHLNGSDDPPVRMRYHRQSAYVEESRGNAAAAYRHLECALEIASESTDLIELTGTYINYTDIACALGNFHTARTCVERALLIARQHQIRWRIAYCCLIYAELLGRTGDYLTARKFVLEALAYEIKTPVVDGLVAHIGIPIALRAGDEGLIARCARLAAIEYAFQSGEPDRIGVTAASFALLYGERGEHRKAQRLLQTALATVAEPNHTWDLSLAIARYGDPSDFSRTRQLLVRRAELPHAHVYQACLCLFDATVALREKRTDRASNSAQEAAQKFEALGLHAYAEDARALLAGQTSAMRLNPWKLRAKAYGNAAAVHPLLTRRERQVTELALQGFTNREIADKLLIKERTVESHMTSIMRHLGVRSRHQLTQAVESGT